MIKPTVGRVVWFHEAFVPDQPEQPQAAIVTFVHSDACVNLVVFDKEGHASGRTSVFLRQEGKVAPSGMFCEWMPYQKGQAAKTELAEAELKAARA
jgi:hypothetical protein